MLDDFLLHGRHALDYRWLQLTELPDA